MADASHPPLHAYTVSLATQAGGLSGNAVIADSPATAAAVLAFALGQAMPPNSSGISGVHTQQITVEWLEAALAACRGEARPSAQVLSLVPNPPLVPNPQQPLSGVEPTTEPERSPNFPAGNAWAGLPPDGPGAA